MAVPERRARALTRRTGRFGDVKMFGRVAAWSLAGFLVVLPAGPGIETSTIAAADAPAAALATANQCRDKAGDKIKIQAQKEDQTDTLAKLAALGPAQSAIASPPAAEPFGLAAVPVDGATGSCSKIAG